MKIKTRLLFGFGTILTMVLILGGVAFWHSKMMWDNTDFLYTRAFKVNIAVRDIQSNVRAIQRSMKDVVLAEDREELDSAKYSILINESEVHQLLDTIYALYIGKRSAVDTAFNLFKAWKPLRDETIRLIEADKKQEALLRTRNIGERHVTLIIDKINHLRDVTQDRGMTFYKSAQRGKNQLYIQLLIIIGVIVILSFATFIYIMRGITVPLGGLVRFAEHYAHGRYDVRNDFKSTNEMGVLAASMNRLAETVQFEMNVKDAVQEIADEMMTYDDLPSFCKLVLDGLMMKTHSNLGAIYLLNTETSMLEPYYSSGYITGNLRSFSAVSNEGELGTIIPGKKVIRITHIPDDSIFIFSTVAGSIKPKEIIAVPVLRRNSVIAVLSLATIEGYNAESLEIIRRSEKNLNMSINAVLAFDRIRENLNDLDKQNEKLNAQAGELQAQTAELVEQNAELEQQKREIDEANHLKSQFLSSMSHELRTPLNSVIALSEVLNKRLKNLIPDEEYSYLEIIARNGQNLLTLINDILDLSRIESGKVEVHYAEISLYDSVEYILESLQTQVRQKNITVRNMIGSEIPLIKSDNDMCHHILQNIIGNAVKFTSEGSVEVSAYVEGPEVFVQVTDTGIGIPDDQLPSIFNEFRQADGTTSRKYGGTGLGLAIADKYARKLNARIDVISKLGKGSVFTIIFPIDPATEKPALSGDQGYRRKSIEEFRLHDLSESETSEKTILIVEDSEPAIIQLSSILEDQGYQIKIARNGFEALQAVRMKVPDAIILDLMIPEMDGFEVLEKIKGTSESSAIPVLILTAMCLNSSDINRLTANNIHQLIQKGDIVKDELLEIIRRMLFPERITKPAIQLKENKRKKISGTSSILIIDDNEDNGTTLKVLIHDSHNVVIVKDGKEGISRAKSLKPDLIFLDISLPGIDGYRVFDEIRKDKNLQHVPIIAVTAKAMTGDREQILAYGFDDYISKPIDPDIFEETISKWIN
ncbi:MAG: response regulator [Bacteroidales bacterium]|nr:response regulator [Bacteroidales bacterium]